MSIDIYMWADGELACGLRLDPRGQIDRTRPVDTALRKEARRRPLEHGLRTAAPLADLAARIELQTADQKCGLKQTQIAASEGFYCRRRHNVINASNVVTYDAAK